jgi:hypothetical protein
LGLGLTGFCSTHTEFALRLACSLQVITLGDKQIEWDDSFRLFLTSKLPNPHYGPEVSGKTMVINYSVTQQGLQEQLLNVTVRHERLDLEEQRERLVTEMSVNNRILKVPALSQQCTAFPRSVLDCFS